MELLSNLVWIAVALALWGIWLADRRRIGRASPSAASPSVAFKVQFVALAVLTLILLPVISVTDDLQATNNPAEAERACVRTDQHLFRPDAPPPPPQAHAVVIRRLALGSLRTFALLRPPSFPRNEPIAHTRALESRPPPFA